MHYHHAIPNLTILLALSVTAIAQEKPESVDTANTSKEAKEYIDRMEMRSSTRNELVQRIEKPLHSYGDAARGNSNGTVWAWGKSGRPTAFLELFRATEPNSPWINAITLTGQETVSLKTGIPTHWKPARTQIEPKMIPDAPAPDAKDNVRLLQMKEQSRRFTAHEFWDPNNSRFELRLLPRPLLRYKDEAAGIHDGTAYILAHDTNPEIVLLIEALGETVEKARWHYSAARLGSAELHLEIDGNGVWKQERTPGVAGKSTDPYWLFFVTP